MFSASSFSATLVFFPLCLIVLVNCCPSDHWIECKEKSKDGKIYCDIPSKNLLGYVAYGGSQIWSRIPFSNYKKQENKIFCNEKIAGKLNIDEKEVKCCWIASEIGIDVLHDWNKIQRSSKPKFFTLYNQKDIARSPHWVRRGRKGRYTYRVATHYMPCDNDNFGYYFNDLILEENKNCQYTEEQPLLGLPNEERNEFTKEEELWEKCVPDAKNNMCSMGTTKLNQFIWVKYGDEQSFNYREILTKHGKFKCSPDLFGDPEQGTKYCYWIKNPNPLLRLQPHWELVSYCRGCDEHNLDVTVGVTLNQQSTISLTKQHSLSTSLGLSAGYMGQGISSNIGYTGTRTKSESLRDTTDLARNSKSTFKCGHYRKVDKHTGKKKVNATTKVYPYAYQWVRGIIDYSTFTQITIATVRYPFIYCSQYSIPPICGPNDATDECNDGSGPKQKSYPALVEKAKESKKENNDGTSV